MPYRMGTHAQNTVRVIVCQMFDGNRRFRESTNVFATWRTWAGTSQCTLFPTTSRSYETRIPVQWRFMTYNPDAGTIWVWMQDEGDWRDQVRDIVLAEIRRRWPDATFDDRGVDGVFTIPTANAWSYTGTARCHISNSMHGRMMGWATRDNCAVSKRILSRFGSRASGWKSAFKQPLEADYLTIREDGMISYLPKGRYESTVHPWRPSSGRQAARPSRMLRSMMTPEALEGLTDKDWEAFASRIKGAAESDKVTIETVKGEDIRYWYHYRRYANSDDTGDLASSCMRYSECQPYFNIYADNPDQVELIIAKNGGDKLMGRALLWTLEDGTKVRDRAYGNEAIRSAIHDWCADRGYERAQGDLSVKLDNPFHSSYPYFDTFHYITPDGRVHTSSRHQHAIGHGSTDGGADLSEGAMVCPDCKDVMGWKAYNRGNSRCQACVDRQRAEEARARVQAFIDNPPEGLTYHEYINLPQSMLRFVGDDLVIHHDGRDVARYTYTPSGYTSGGAIFTLQPVAVPV